MSTGNVIELAPQDCVASQAQSLLLEVNRSLLRIVSHRREGRGMSSVGILNCRSSESCPELEGIIGSGVGTTLSCFAGMSTEGSIGCLPTHGKNLSAYRYPCRYSWSTGSSVRGLSSN